MVYYSMVYSTTSGPHIGSHYIKDHCIAGSNLGPPTYADPLVGALWQGEDTRGTSEVGLVSNGPSASLKCSEGVPCLVGGLEWWESGLQGGLLLGSKGA